MHVVTGRRLSAALLEPQFARRTYFTCSCSLPCLLAPFHHTLFHQTLTKHQSHHGPRHQIARRIPHAHRVRKDDRHRLLGDVVWSLARLLSSSFPSSSFSWCQCTNSRLYWIMTTYSKVISPIFEKMAADGAFPSIEFYNVDVDEQEVSFAFPLL